MPDDRRNSDDPRAEVCERHLQIGRMLQARGAEVLEQCIDQEVSVRSAKNVRALRLGLDFIEAGVGMERDSTSDWDEYQDRKEEETLRVEEDFARTLAGCRWAEAIREGSSVGAALAQVLDAAEASLQALERENAELQSKLGRG